MPSLWKIPLVALMGPQERGNKAMNHTLPFLSRRPNIPSPPHTPEPHLTRGSASTVVPPFPSCCQLCTHWRTEQHGDVPTAQGQPQALSSFMAPWRTCLLSRTEPHSNCLYTAGRGMAVRLNAWLAGGEGSSPGTEGLAQAPCLSSSLRCPIFSCGHVLGWEL